MPLGFGILATPPRTAWRRCAPSADGGGDVASRDVASYVSTRSMRVRRKNGFRHEHVDAEVAVHQLRVVDIARHADEHVSVVAAEVLLANEKVDHAQDRQSRRFLQVRVKTHADV